MFRIGRIFPISVPPAHPNPLTRVFFDIDVGGNPLGRIVFQLFDNVAPKTATNFLRIAQGVQVDGKKLHYEGSQINKILPFRGLWGGTLGGSIYGRTFPDENYRIKHDRAGLLTTSNPKINSNDAGFIITLGPAEWLDRKSVAFGEVIYGFQHVRAIEKLGGLSGAPKKTVLIKHSGIITEHEYHKYDAIEEPNIWNLQSHH
ncbi:unnamed protein product [Paramecium sonneborni]|uniref:PPIase cyclophilin-type domain-containing protein n=1 Tax=Paramecium sonneborni TaxID=65129 RepID=A0A8S1NTE7_9CILI|nr:unnamed protein product [Paramecium sonneborni]